MFDILTVFFSLGAFLAEVEKKIIKTEINRDKAIKTDSQYYFDGNSRYRSTKTNEILVRDDGKLTGVKTNKVYIDFVQCRVDECNEKRKRCGSPVYMGHCKKHYDIQSNSFTCYHLREKETDRMYEICTFRVLDEKGHVDETQFYIVYLDEDFNHQELKKVSSELRFYYQGFYNN